MDYKNDIKRIQALKNKKFRKEYKQFIVEGDKIINEALVSDLKFDGIWINKDVEHKISEKASQRGIEVKLVNQRWLEKAGNLQSNNFGIAILNIPVFDKIDLRSGWVLALDSINDPGNFGTIIRSAEWYGIETILCSPNSVDLYNPKVLMASKGSFLRVKIAYDDLKDVFASYKGTILAADMGGKSIYDLENNTNKGILLMGSESHGISKELESFISERIHIPGKGNAESLNLGVAASIILDHLSRLKMI